MTAGRAVSSAGDINNDGIGDFAIGARNYDIDPDNQNVGAVFVFFGKKEPFSPNLGPYLNGENGFLIEGFRTNDPIGEAVANAGDVNNDGVDDLLLSSPTADLVFTWDYGSLTLRSAGEAYVVLGREDGSFPSRLNLADLDGTNGFTILSGNSRENTNFASYVGRSVSGAGDVNDDGIDDFIIGSDYSGAFNRDGFDDVIIGAFGATRDGKVYVGESCLIFGKAGGFDPAIDLVALDKNTGILFQGVAEREQSGFAVAGAGDVNRDGYGDIIIGAPGAGVSSPDSPGKAYVVFGKPISLISPGEEGCEWDRNNDGDVDGNDLAEWAAAGLDSADLNAFSLEFGRIDCQ